MAKKGLTTYDSSLVKEKALPASATSVTTDGIDLGQLSDELGVRSERFELEISAPNLTATQLPSGASVAYQLEASNDNEFGSYTAWELSDLAQTGGASGAVGGTVNFKPSIDSQRYWRVKATVTGTPGSSIADSKVALKYVC